MEDKPDTIKTRKPKSIEEKKTVLIALNPADEENTISVDEISAEYDISGCWFNSIHYIHPNGFGLGLSYSWIKGESQTDNGYTLSSYSYITYFLDFSYTIKKFINTTFSLGLPIMGEASQKITKENSEWDDYSESVSGYDFHILFGKPIGNFVIIGAYSSANFNYYFSDIDINSSIVASSFRLGLGYLF